MALPIASPVVAVSPRARRAYLVFYAACRTIHTSSPAAQFDRGQFRRSDFSGQGFTGIYEPGGPTVGPLGDASAGEPLVTPRLLKDHLDQFVVGQERSKKVLSVAVYNHYQRVQELHRKEEEEQALYEQAARRAEAARHPVEGEYPGQNATVNTTSYHSGGPTPPSPESQIHPRYTTPPPTQSLLDPGATPVIEKSNVLLLGPSGVGKTLMAKTLARILDVPFSISDCTPFTQAGYIGEDVEVCVQRLLAAANYDVARAERGIICLDEVDKIATAKVSHGKDVSGEGVQQALLKIIEGTTVQVQAKAEKGSSTGSPGRNAAGYNPTSGPGGTGSSNQQQQQQLNKGDVYNINTDNILFICTGAFIGLHKVIMDRIAKGSIGFGARVRSSVGLSEGKDNNDPTVPADKTNDELFKKHLPFYSDVTPATEAPSNQDLPSETEPATYNTLDLTTPSDLQKYGLIPELIGRIPTVCALSPLSLQSLVRVLTEPRNSLVSQYVHLFSLSNMTLHLTTAALWEIARGARAMGTGARGLRAGMERCLAEAMFDGPGSGARFCLVDRAVAARLRAPWLFAKRDAAVFQERIRADEEEWERRRRGAAAGEVEPGPGTFEQYRERVRIAGAG